MYPHSCDVQLVFHTNPTPHIERPELGHINQVQIRWIQCLTCAVSLLKLRPLRNSSMKPYSQMTVSSWHTKQTTCSSLLNTLQKHPGHLNCHLHPGGWTEMHGKFQVSNFKYLGSTDRSLDKAIKPTKRSEESSNSCIQVIAVEGRDGLVMIRESRGHLPPKSCLWKWIDDCKGPTSESHVILGSDHWSPL